MWRKRAIAGMAVVGLVAVLVAACRENSDRPVTSDVSTIAVRDYVFEPLAVSVGVGEVVTWVWEGQAQHDVVGDGFQSPPRSSGTFRHSFEHAGTYRFACSFHPGMQAEVVVEGSAGYGQ